MVVYSPLSLLLELDELKVSMNEKLDKISASVRELIVSGSNKIHCDNLNILKIWRCSAPFNFPFLLFLFALFYLLCI